MRTCFAMLMLPLFATASGCYLVHERPDPIDAAVSDAASVDAGRDAFRPRDAGRDAPRPDGWMPVEPAFCPLPVCPDIDHTIMLDRVATGIGDPACGTLDLDLTGSADDSCGSESTARFAVTRCVGSMTYLELTVTRSTGESALGWFVYRPSSCSCGLFRSASPVDVGWTGGFVYLSNDHEDGVLQYALSGDDVSVHVEACAF